MNYIFKHWGKELASAMMLVAPFVQYIDMAIRWASGLGGLILLYFAIRKAVDERREKQRLKDDERRRISSNGEANKIG